MSDINENEVVTVPRTLTRDELDRETTGDYLLRNTEPEKVSIIEQAVQRSIDTMDKAHFTKIKDILDKTFGPDNNQIAKPTLKETFQGMRNRGFDVAALKGKTLNQVSNIMRQYPPWFCIYVKFPSITITNSTNKSHDITDLFVRIGLYSDGTIHSTIYGTRGSLSAEEFASGYVHSHLPTVTTNKGYCDMKFVTFCLGIGEIRQSLLNLNTAFNEIDFQLFCLHLCNYVKWESIEGNPYRLFSGISGNISTGFESLSYPEQRAAKLTKALLRINPSILADNITINITSKLVKVTGKSDFAEMLGRLLLCIPELEASSWRHNPVRNATSLVVRDQYGRFQSLPRENINRGKLNPNPIFEFKGEPVILTVREPNVSSDNNIKTTYYAHPTLVTAVCGELSKYFTEAYVANEEVAIGNSPYDNQEATGTSDFPLLAGARE